MAPTTFSCPFLSPAPGHAGHSPLCSGQRDPVGRGMKCGVCAPLRAVPCCPLSRGPRHGVGRRQLLTLTGELGPRAQCTLSSWSVVLSPTTPCGPKLKEGSEDAQSRHGATPTASRHWAIRGGEQARGSQSPHWTMTYSHRPSSPALALVLLFMLLGGEWDHLFVRPSVHALLILGNIHPQQPTQCPHHTDGETEAGPGQDPFDAWDECLKGREGEVWDI